MSSGGNVAEEFISGSIFWLTDMSEIHGELAGKT